MAEPDSLILAYLRRLDEKLDRVIGDVGDLRQRVGLVEQQILVSHQHYAAVSGRLDRIDQRLDRLESRTGLIDA